MRSGGVPRDYRIRSGVARNGKRGIRFDKMIFTLVLSATMVVVSASSGESLADYFELALALFCHQIRMVLSINGTQIDDKFMAARHEYPLLFTSFNLI